MFIQLESKRGLIHTDSDDPFLECKFCNDYNDEHEKASSGYIFLELGWEKGNVLTIATCICFYIQLAFFFRDFLQKVKKEEERPTLEGITQPGSVKVDWSPHQTTINIRKKTVSRRIRPCSEDP